VQRLRLPRTQTHTSIQGISNVNMSTGHSVSIHLRSRHTNWHTALDCAILPNITGMTPANKLNTTDWKIPTDIKLADEHFHQPGNIDLLIGADLLHEMSLPGRRTRPGNYPVLQETVLGWTIVGRTPANTTVKEVKRAFLQREPHITEHKLGQGSKLKVQEPKFMKKHEETSQKSVKFKERTEIYYFRPHHPVSKEIRSTLKTRFVSGGSDKLPLTINV